MAKLRVGRARVSTDDQAYKVGLTNQIQRLRDAGCDRIYADIASRADEANDGIIKLMADIEAGEVGEVVVVTLDRLTSSIVVLKKFTKLVTELGISVIGLDETIDLADADGVFSASLSTLFAEREVAKIRSRSQRGHDGKKRHLRANAAAPFGYLNKDRGYVLNDAPLLCLLTDRPTGDTVLDGRTFADLARDSIAMFEQYPSISQAVRQIHIKYGIQLISDASLRTKKRADSFVLTDDLSIARLPKSMRQSTFSWTDKGFRNWLLNPVLVGDTSYNTREFLGLDSSGRRKYGRTLPQAQWEIHRDTHPDQALLTRAQQDGIRDRIEMNARARPKWIEDRDHRHPISGKVRCGACGGTVKTFGSKWLADGKLHNYYYCRNAKVNQSCDQNLGLRNDRIEDAIIAALIEKAGELDRLRRLPLVQESKPPSPELKKLRDQLAGLIALGSNPALIAAADEVRAQILALERVEAVETVERTEAKEYLTAMSGDPNFWAFARSKTEFMTRLFHHCVDYVKVRDGRILQVFLRV
jgi:site-specific DNA recombinase